MIKNSKNQNETDVIFEGLRTLEAILSTVKDAVKIIKQYENKALRLSLKNYNAIKNNLYFMTMSYNKICDDTEKLARVLMVIGEIPEKKFKAAIEMVDTKRQAYLAFKRSQPDYIKKLMA
ncbi:MAG: hypothetical protein E7544_08530 [Ruminococcaceae bacterium]|nr:hypothetical protein [Oscillospiraceae bacterium]